MAVDNSLMIRRIIQRPSMIVAYCVFTNMPFVVCDDDTYDDEVFIFETEDLFKEFAKKYAEDKIAVRGVRFMNKDFLRFYSTLFTMGVNMLVFRNTSGDFRIELDKLVRRPDYSKMPQKPVTNPALVLTGMYYLQEARRPVASDEKNLKDLNEEFVTDLTKSRYLVGVILKEGPESDAEKMKKGQFQFPILNDRKGGVYLPVFTDPVEFQKFAKGDKKYKVLAVPFRAMLSFLPKNCTGFMLNPFGFAMPLPRELMETITKEAEELKAEEESGTTFDPSADHIIEDDDTQ